MKLNPLDDIPSPIVIGIVLGVFFLFGPLLMQLGETFLPQNPTAGQRFTVESLLWLLIYPLIALNLWIITGQQRDEIELLVLQTPSQTESRVYRWLGLGMVVSAFGFAYLMFYPLSFVSPQLVQAWLLDSPSTLYWDAEGWYLLGNLANIITAIVFAPIVEEYIFRAYLLNRWTRIFSAKAAVIWSSLLFAILHPDVLGAFVFAVIQCLLYMKTRSLVGPIIVHMSNNVVAVFLEWLDLAFLSGFKTATVEDFQNDLWIGVVGLVIGVPWLWRFVQNYLQPVSAVLSLHEQGQATPPTGSNQLLG